MDPLDKQLKEEELGETQPDDSGLNDSDEGEIDVDDMPLDKDKTKKVLDDVDDLDVEAVDEEIVPVDLENVEFSKDDDDAMVHKGEMGEDTATTPLQEPTFFADEMGNLKFVNLTVRRPCTIFFTILILCFFVSFLLVAIVFRDGSPFTNPENEFDMDDVRSIQYDSLRLARDEVEDARDAKEQLNGGEVRIQSEAEDLTYWVFEAQQEEGLFGTAESIAAMREAFDLFLDHADYDKYCKLEYDSENASAPAECETPTSPLNMYYASEWDTDMVAHVIEELKDPANLELFNDLALCYTLGLYCENVPSNITTEQTQWVMELSNNLTAITDKWDMKGELVQNFTQVTELASYLIQVNVYKGFVDFGFDKQFSTDNLISRYSRGILFWGGPLNLSSSDSSNDETLDKDEKSKQDEEDLKDYIVDNFLDEMNDQASSGQHDSLNSYYFMGALIFDVLLGIVQKDGLLAIFSLVFVFIWIRINTGSWFLAGVGILEIFFSIPVAWFIFSVVFQLKYFSFLNALSIFIVAAIGADDIFIFMDAYKQSKSRNPEHLVSLETRMSWVYRRTGTAMAITSATSCSAFLCTLITPLAGIQSFGIFAAFVIFIDYALVMTLFCSAVVIYHDRYEDRRTFCGCCNDCSRTDPSPTKAAREALMSGEEDTSGDPVSEFFRNRVAGFIKGGVNRAVLGVIFVSWLVVATWQTTKIEPTKETEQFLDDSHPLQKSIDILNTQFPTAEDDLGLSVYYAWGLGEVDRSGVKLLFDPENFGQPIFLDSFDFNEGCQTELVKACDKLKTDSRYLDLIKREEGLGSVFCFVEELAAYSVKGNLDDCDYVKRGEWKNESWQVSPNDLSSVMESFVQEYSCVDKTKTIMTQYENELGWDGESLRYAAIAAESQHLDPFTQQPESFTRAEYNQFISIAKELDETVSEYCSGNVIMTDLDTKFVFMNNQAIYVRSALQSALLGVAIAFTVLMMSTWVLHIAFFASLSIISVLVSVTGMMVMLGWQLGSIESILISIIAGFSVDYVVHLAHAYESASGDSLERLTAAFGDMGISVLNGMVTSVAASIPLFFCQLQFFAKFGTFLCLTIAFSWIFANFGFMSVLAQLKIPIKNGKGCRL